MQTCGGRRGRGGRKERACQDEDGGFDRASTPCCFGTAARRRRGEERKERNDGEEIER